MKAVLLKDILSGSGKSQVKYGLRNEVVNLICDRGNVLIVEGKTGRFPVNKKDVQII